MIRNSFCKILVKRYRLKLVTFRLSFQSKIVIRPELQKKSSSGIHLEVRNQTEQKYQFSIIFK